MLPDSARLDSTTSFNSTNKGYNASESSPNHSIERASTAVGGSEHAIATDDKEREAAELENDDQTSSDDDEYEEEFQERVDAILHGADMPYNPLEEGLPKFAAYHPSFLKVEQHCKELVRDTIALLRNAEYKDPRILQLTQKALESLDINYPPARKIGLMGDSGVGKSYVLFYFSCSNPSQTQDLGCMY